MNQDIYRALLQKKKKLESTTLEQLFKKDKNREEKFSFQRDGLLFDFSKNLLDSEVLQIFEKQSQKIQLQVSIEKMFSGEKINHTENNSVLHIALRKNHQQKNHQQKNQQQKNYSLTQDETSIDKFVADELQKMKSFCQKLQTGVLKGSTGKKINTLVHIGIGGSFWGMKMTTFALKSFQTNNIKFFFASHLSGNDLSCLNECNPEQTLFLICSKTFQTEETICNALLAKEWLQNSLQDKFIFAKHFVAITAETKKALEFGMAEESIFAIKSWVGGRFSVSSAMNLILMTKVGYQNFKEFLAGMNLEDEAFLKTPFLQNIPILLAWIGIWYRNFWDFPSLAILPYSQELKHLPNYLQQLEMESNGKSITRSGEKLSHPTSPVIFGQIGTDFQHSFVQFLSQGTGSIPCDFIAFATACGENSLTKKEMALERHQRLISHFFSQQLALAFGTSAFGTSAFETGNSEKETLEEPFAKFKQLEGNRPSQCLFFDRLTPKNLGRLIAIYEHKVFVQGLLWDIFSFDQWGVEQGKRLAKKILPHLQKKEKISADYRIKKQADFFQHHFFETKNKPFKL